MTVIRQAAQVVPGGSLIASQPNIVSIWKHDGDALLSSTISTDAEGFWQYTYTPEGSNVTEWILNPGPLYWSLGYLGKVRKGSSKAAAMVGANSLLELPEMMQTFGTDIVVQGAIAGDFAVTYDGAGLDLDVAAGYAIVRGVGVKNPSTRKVTLGIADGALPRIDTVVLELTRTEGDTEGKVVLKAIAGTPNAAPVPPTLTQDANTWHFPLLDARVNAGSVNINSTTERRVFQTSGYVKNPVVMPTPARSDTIVALTTTATSVASLAISPTLISGVWYDIEVVVDLFVDGALAVAMIAPFINGTTNAAAFISAPPQAGIITLRNAHTYSMQGTGAAISCGVLAKRSGTENIVYYYGGVATARAIPRS